MSHDKALHKIYGYFTLPLVYDHTKHSFILRSWYKQKSVFCVDGWMDRQRVLSTDHDKVEGDDIKLRSLTSDV